MRSDHTTPDVKPDPDVAAAAAEAAAVHQPRSISFQAVNGWRGPGALAIAVAHLGVATDFVAARYLQPIALLVDLFFVLSGLLITQAYAEKLKRPSAFPEYVMRRLGRIWPVQAVTLALLVAYELAKLAAQTMAGRHFSSPAFASDGINLLQAVPTNLLLIHSLGIHDRETWNFPSWSLSVEFFTYVVFAFFCLFSPWLRRTLAAATIVMSVAVLIFIAPYQMRSTFDYGMFRCFAGFFAGSLCYEAVRRWPLSKLPMPTLFEISALVMIGAWMSVSPGSYLAFLAPLVICLFLSAFLEGRGMISRLLKAKPVQILAEWSFAIYMVHALVLIFILALLHQVEKIGGRSLFVTAINPLAGHPGAPAAIQVIHFDSAASRWAIGIIYVASVLLLAYAVHRFVEKPGRSIFGRLAKRFGRKPSATNTSSASFFEPLRGVL